PRPRLSVSYASCTRVLVHSCTQVWVQPLHDPDSHPWFARPGSVRTPKPRSFSNVSANSPGLSNQGQREERICARSSRTVAGPGGGRQAATWVSVRDRSANTE